MSSVQVNIDFARIISRFTAAQRRGKLALKGQIAADTAPYVPRVTGDLEHSVKPSDTTDDNFLKWTAPYARRQYYGQFKHSIQAHALATRRWYDVAKAIFKARWLKVAERAFKVG